LDHNNKQEKMNSEKNRHEIPGDVLIKYLCGSATEEERNFARRWINENAENKKYFDEVKNYYQLSKMVQNPSGYDKEAGWNRVKAGYYKTKLQKEQSVKTRKYILRAIISSAALIILAAGLFIYYQNNTLKNELQTQKYHKISVPLGAKSYIILSDSTKVWLNAGSTLRYPENFSSGKREVYLEGEGYFDVTRNEQKQFIVNTSGLRVLVYGTQFNVKSYPDENSIQTTLIKGSVAIEPLISNSKVKPVYLKPNQTATFYKSSLKIEKSTINQAMIDNKIEPELIEKIVIKPKVNPTPITSWKDKEWVFDHEGLGDLAVKLERRYNVNIIFDDKGLTAYKFTGTITEETFEQVLKIIQLSAPITYSISGNNVTLKEDPYYKKKYDKMILNSK
jgi:transmembrane sensor